MVDLAGLKQVVENSDPDYILLDNFTLHQLRDAVHWCTEFRKKSGARGHGFLLESSGGITRETLVAVAETGVDRISLGALTHTVIPLDVSLEMKL